MQVESEIPGAKKYIEVPFLAFKPLPYNRVPGSLAILRKTVRRYLR